MANKVFFNIEATKINYDCPFYQQNVNTGARYCIDLDVLRFVGGVNDAQTTNAEGKKIRAKIMSCLGCKNFGMAAIKNEKRLTKERILKIKAGQTLDLSLSPVQLEKRKKRLKNRDVFEE